MEQRLTKRGSVLERLFPSEYERAAWPAMIWIALAGLVLLAFASFLSRDLGRAGLTLLLIASLLSIPRIRRGDPDAWVYLVLLGFLTLMLAVNWWATKAYPEVTDRHWPYTRGYLKLFGFLITGWWLGGGERNVLLFLWLAAAGLVLGVFLKADISEWGRLFAGERVQFGLLNAQHAGALFGSVLIGTIAFSGRIFAPCGHKRLRCRGIRTAWFVLVAVSLLVVVGAQTRQTWIGLMIALAAGLAWQWAGRRDVSSTVRIWPFIAVGGLVALGVASLFSDAFVMLWDRTVLDWQGLHRFAAGQSGGLAESSTAVRLLQWEFALDAIGRHPWIGHGGATKGYLLQHSGLPEDIRANYGHLHNSYLELWVAYGVLAPTLFIGILGGLAWRLIAARRSGGISHDIALFGIAWLGFFATINLFESYVKYDSGRFLILVVGGALYGITIPARRARARMLNRAPDHPPGR